MNLRSSALILAGALALSGCGDVVYGPSGGPPPPEPAPGPPPGPAYYGPPPGAPPPPAPYFEPPPPPPWPGAVWIRGHWVWGPNGWYWRHGHYRRW